MHSRQFLLLTLLASTSPALAQFFSTQVDEPLPEATFTTTSVSGAEQTTTELPPATFITSPEPSESSTESESESGSGFSTDLNSDDDSETSTSTDSVATLTIPEGFITESPTGSTTYILPSETSTLSSDDDDDDESDDQDQVDDDDTPSTTTSSPTTLSTTTNIEDLLTDTASPTPTGGAGAIALDPVVLFACAALGLAGFGTAF